MACPQPRAFVDGAFVPAAGGIHPALAAGPRFAADRTAGVLSQLLAGGDAFDRHRLDDDFLIGGDKSELLAMRLLEPGAHGPQAAEADQKSRVGAGVAQMKPGHHGGRTPGGCALRLELGQSSGGERSRDRAHMGDRTRRELPVHGLLAAGANIGEAHAVRRQNAGERMNEHGGHAEGVGYLAGMLGAGAAKAVEHVRAHIIAAHDRDLLDGVGHVLDGDPDEALGHRLRRPAAADPPRKAGKGAAHPFGIERLHPGSAEDLRKVLGIDPSQHQVGIGQSERPAAAITGGAGIGPRGVRSDTKPRAVEVEDGTAACRDRVNAQHRRAHAHPGDLGFENALEFAVEMRHIGGGAAHVEADEAAETRHASGFRHPHHAAGGPRKDGILAVKEIGRGEAARGHHEHELRAVARRAVRLTAGNAKELLFDDAHVTAQNGREIGVDDRGVAAPDQLQQGGDFMRNGNLGEAQCAGEAGQLLFVLVEAISVQEHDGDRPDACRKGGHHADPCMGKVERDQNLSFSAQSLPDFDHPVVEKRRFDDIEIEQAGASLIADLESIPESLGDDEKGALALALQERVGGDRRAHLDAGDGRGGNRRTGAEAHELADAGDRITRRASSRWRRSASSNSSASIAVYSGRLASTPRTQ